jgi:hypothetical protein
MSYLSKLSKKAKVSEDFLKAVVLKEYELSFAIPKTKLKTINLEVEGKEQLKNLKELSRIAKTLNVSLGAVICVGLENYLDSKTK